MVELALLILAISLTLATSSIGWEVPWPPLDTVPRTLPLRPPDGEGWK